MRRVGVLIFVHQNVTELLVILLQNIGVAAEDADRVHQKIAEIAGIQRFQPVLIGGIELAALAIGEGAAVSFRNIRRRQALVLPAVDHAGELFGRPAFVIETFGLDELLDQPHHVIRIENGEIRLQADEFGVTTQQLDADGVERAEPGHALDRAADENADAFLHLAGGLVGEGHGKDLAGIGPARCENMGNAGCQNTGLAGAGAGETRTGPSSVSTASRCSGLRPER